MEQDHTKAPRLFLNTDLSQNGNIELDKDQSHYLLNVMRKDDGDTIRIFNGRDGEFLGIIQKQSKKSCVITSLSLIKDQPSLSREVHLHFAPIKKDRMAFMIEKAVELGVTDLHPTLTEHTQHGKINIDKIEKYIIEASEQCERMDIPTLHPAQKFMDSPPTDNSLIALERDDTKLFTPQPSSDPIHIFIGPEGGWSNDERRHINAAPQFTPVSLGDNILRAETAAIFMLSRIDKST